MKKIFVFLLTGLLAFTMISCASNDQASNDEDLRYDNVCIWYFDTDGDDADVWEKMNNYMDMLFEDTRLNVINEEYSAGTLTEEEAAVTLNAKGRFSYDSSTVSFSLTMDNMVTEEEILSVSSKATFSAPSTWEDVADDVLQSVYEQVMETFGNF